MTATPNSLTFIDPATGETLRTIELDRPANLASYFTSWKTSHIVDELAKQLGMDCDEINVPEHRRDLDPAGRLLVGHGLEYSKASTRKISDDVFEVTCSLHLTAGKHTGPNACTYVGTYTRTLTLVAVKNYAA